MRCYVLPVRVEQAPKAAFSSFVICEAGFLICAEWSLVHAVECSSLACVRCRGSDTVVNSFRYYDE